MAVMPHLHDIRDAYPTYRQVQEPATALQSAIVAAMGNGPEVTELFAFLRGELDGEYGPGAGGKLAELILEQSESRPEATQHETDRQERTKSEEVAQHEADFQARQHRRRQMDIVDLAESLSSDRMITLLFRQAFEARDVRMRDELLDDAEGQILQRASQAWTNAGRDLKLEQAASVVRLMERKALAVPGDPAAEDQALWCLALAHRLSPRPKRS